MDKIFILPDIMQMMVGGVTEIGEILELSPFGATPPVWQLLRSLIKCLRYSAIRTICIY